MSMKFTPQTIRIRGKDGFKEEQAIVAGPFAIHQTRWKDWTPTDDAWTVTHVPSGYCFFQDAPSELHARRFCEEVADLFDWTLEVPQLRAKKNTPEYGLLRRARDKALGWLDDEPEVAAVPS